MLLLPLAAVLVAGGAFAVAWSQRGAEEASVEEAVRELDGRGGTEGSFLRPAGGVYVYEGTGTEQLSLLATGQQWGPQLPASVVAAKDSGCWVFKIEYSTNHRQWTTYCPQGRTLEEHGGRTFQSFDFVVSTIDDENRFVCEPPGDTIRVDAEPGATWSQSCRGRSEQRGTEVTSSGTNTFVGIETVDVDGRAVRAYRYHGERTLTGDQTGREVVETWYRVRDGLPLRVSRDVLVESPSPIGTVTYTEQGTYALTSLTPRR